MFCQPTGFTSVEGVTGENGYRQKQSKGRHSFCSFQIFLFKAADSCRKGISGSACWVQNFIQNFSQSKTIERRESENISIMSAPFLDSSITTTCGKLRHENSHILPLGKFDNKTCNKICALHWKTIKNERGAGILN